MLFFAFFESDKISQKMEPRDEKATLSRNDNKKTTFDNSNDSNDNDNNSSSNNNNDNNDNNDNDNNYNRCDSGLRKQHC